MIDDARITESAAGPAFASFTVSLVRASSETVTVQYSTTDGTAVAGSDYTAVGPTTLTFAPGEVSKTASVEVLDDNFSEPNEVFFVKLANPTNANLRDASGRVAIVSDEPNPTLRVSDASVTEGADGTTTIAAFTVSLPAPNSEPVTVQYMTTDGTARTPGDYTAPPATILTFIPGEVSKTISVEVQGDAMFELNETFFVSLSNASGAVIADAQGQGTIMNDDPRPELRIGDAVVTEGVSGTTAATFTVTLSGTTDQPVSVLYTSVNGTALSPADYASLRANTVTFAPGETTKTVTVDVQGDAMFEPDEIFFVNLQNATGASLADAQGQGTILNDDPMPRIAISDTSKAEGNDGQSNAMVVVSLSNASSQIVTVQYATADGTATALNDYVPLAPTTLTFNPGELSKSIPVGVKGDNMFEPDETISVNLGNPTNATLADAQATVVIVNDDAQPTIRITSIRGDEGASGTTRFPFLISLSNPSSETITVQYATEDGEASAPEDYVATPLTTLTFKPLETSKAVFVTVNGDAVFEPDETFYVNLSNATNAEILAAQGAATIRNDEPIPLLRVDDVRVTEGAAGGATASFIVSLSGPSSEAVFLRYATADGTATAPADYTAIALSTLRFARGETSKTVAVEVRDDEIFEQDESFFLNLSEAAGATIADSQGRGTIVNDEPLPAITVGNVMVGEGADGTALASFNVMLTRPSSEAISVQYATADGTATASDDYRALPLSNLTFNPGETSKTIAVEVKGDTLFEADETFFLDLSNPTNALLRDTQGAATILDDEAVPLLSINDVSVLEGADGTATATFTVMLSGPSSQTVSVQYATADGTATALEDYAPLAPDNLVFAPGETSQTIAVSVKGDDVFESDETFFVDLTNATGAELSDAHGAGTILNDEGLPALSIGDVALLETIRGTSSALFTLTLSRPSSESISVQYATADGTANAGSDYLSRELSTLTFSPGEVAKTVAVEVNGDTAAEADESFFLNLSAPVNATLTDTQAEATILNDDVAVTISADGKKARFSDVDGDEITVKTTLGSFVPENFVFTSSGTWQALDLRAPETQVGFGGAALVVTAKTPVDSAGDGFVSLGAIDAFGLRLKSVKVDGALGQIDAGESTLGKSALKNLTVQSLGPGAAAGEESTIAGTLGTFKTKGDLSGVLHVTGGVADAAANFTGTALTRAVIGGALDGSAGGERAGLIDVAGGIGSVLVKGSVTGGAELSGIVAGGPVGTITVAGNLTSDDADRPVTISALGTLGATTPTAALALGTLSVGGGVLRAQVLAGYTRELTPANGTASIGSIEVAGGWNASSAVAGIADVTGDGFGRNDAPISGAPLPGLLSRIARITIHGIAAGSPASGDFFGITAQHIGRVLAGSIRPPLSAGANDFLLDPLNDDFRVVDFA